MAIPIPSYSLVNSNYYGNSGLILEEQGELTTDLYGLTTCSVTAKCSWQNPGAIPGLFSAHPNFSWLNVERQRIRPKDGFFWVTLEYAGVYGGTDAIYELCLGVGEEPIETHNLFASSIAGSPSAPKHGAIFLDPQTGDISHDDSIGVFDRFAVMDSGSPNQFAGIQSYLDFNQAIWREKYYTSGRPSDSANVGRIQSPAGPYPSLGGSRNWILQSLNYEQRGLVYGVTREWKASGPKGWNPIIYG